MSLNINREPTAVLTGVGALLASLAKLAVLLGWVQWDAIQLAAVSLVIDNALLVLGALFVRSQVTPTASPALEKGTEVTQLDRTTGQPTGRTTTV